MSNKKNLKPDEAKQLSSQITGLERRLAESQQELDTRDERIARLEEVITSKDGEAETLRQQSAEAAENSQRLQDQLSDSLAEYRALATETNPELPPELLAGDTIAAVKESLEKARSLVGRVRQGLEAEAVASRIPAGAPGRTPPDLSGLSPSQKIKYAIGGR